MPTLHVYWSHRHPKSEQSRLEKAAAQAFGGPEEVVIWYHWFRTEDVYIDGTRLDKLGLRQIEDRSET